MVMTYHYLLVKIACLWAEIVQLTYYGLGVSGDRIPVGVKFSAPPDQLFQPLVKWVHVLLPESKA